MTQHVIRRYVVVLMILLICFVSNHAVLALDQQQSEPGKVKEVLAPRHEQVLSTVNVTATGYTAGYESTGKGPNHPLYGITFSGVKVHRNKLGVSTIAADPALFPLGTVLYIPGYGYGIVADTGSAIKGSKIDLYFPTVKEVYSQWGKKDVQVQVIKLGKGKCTEQMLKQLGEALMVNQSIPDALLNQEI